MTDNPVAEIIARAMWDHWISRAHEPIPYKENAYIGEAHAIIAALEGAGWKVKREDQNDT